MQIIKLSISLVPTNTKGYRMSREDTDMGEVSDGYHTFNELYDFRKTYNALLFNEWAKNGKYDVHKSRKHHDGEECFGGGWFVVVAVLPAGQITNHYEMEDWDMFQVPEVEKAKHEFDGHTASDSLDRMKELIEDVPKDETENKGVVYSGGSAHAKSCHCIGPENCTDENCNIVKKHKGLT